MGALPSEDPTQAADKVRLTPKKRLLKITIDRKELIAFKKKRAAIDENAKGRISKPVLWPQQPANEDRVEMPSAIESITDRIGVNTTKSTAHANQILTSALDNVLADGIEDRMIAARPDYRKFYYQAAAAKSYYRLSDASILLNRDDAEQLPLSRRTVRRRPRPLLSPRLPITAGTGLNGVQVMAMRIEKAIASIYGLADRWVRLQEVQRVPRGLVLSFGVHKGKRGAQIEAWRIICIGVHAANITAWDLGGLALYSSNHPAAREHTALQARLRWSGAVDEVLLLGALYKAHSEAVDEWIPFESYSSVKSIPNDGFFCDGPDFLMRAYAKALRSIGKQPHLILGRRKRKVLLPKVLHFGTSHVVANKFIAERCGEKTGGRSVSELKAGTKTKGRHSANAGGPSDRSSEDNN